jgi:predicted O-methyltransferase YrrM
MKSDGWFDFPDFYDFALRQFHKGIFVEIGTWKGMSIVYMARKIKETGKNIQLFGIDTFLGTDEDYMLMEDEDLKSGNLYLEYLRTIEPYKDIINTIVGDSHVVFDQFRDNSIDFLFIDGDHRYQGINTDLDLWLPKVKTGGIISGHDYEKSATCGVKDAVDEHFNKVGVMGRCWFYKL